MRCALILIAGGLLLVGGERLLGQDYRMDWQAVHSGGGVAVGGGYVLSGSVGQVESGDVIAGEEYSWQGGFWSGWVDAGQVQEAPRLVINWDGDQVTLSWPEGAGGYILEETEDLESPVWVTSGVENGVPVTPPTGRAVYYRLAGN
jgi:hypothetical protein